MSTVTAVPIQPVKRGYLIWLWLGIVLAVAAAFLLARQGDPALVREQRGGGIVTTASGLQYKVLTAGAATGARPTAQDVALINYEGKLLDGTTFDKSQQPTPIPVAGVVPGFSEALKLMRKGAKWRIWLPPSLGYGDRTTGPIPPNSTLVFDLELVDFRSEAEIRQMQMMQGALGGAPGAPGAVPPPPSSAAPPTGR